MSTRLVRRLSAAVAAAETVAAIAEVEAVAAEVEAATSRTGCPDVVRIAEAQYLVELSLGRITHDAKCRGERRTGQAKGAQHPWRPDEFHLDQKRIAEAVLEQLHRGIGIASLPRQGLSGGIHRRTFSTKGEDRYV